MAANSDRSVLTATLAQLDSETIIAEGDRMEVELGGWLAARMAMLVANSESRGRACGRNFHPSLWRTLVLVWATSPGARTRYSEAARKGLISAVEAMDARSLTSLISSLLVSGGPKFHRCGGRKYHTR